MLPFPSFPPASFQLLLDSLPGIVLTHKNIKLNNFIVGETISRSLCAYSQVRNKVKGLQLGTDVIWRQGIFMEVLGSSVFCTPWFEIVNVSGLLCP